MSDSISQDTPKKQCTKCCQLLPATSEYFHANKASKDGLVSRCKECIREYGKQYREAHKEELAERERQYRKAHKEEIAERKRQHRKAHKEEIYEKKRQYAEAHRDLFRASTKKYNHTDRGRLVSRANLHKRVARKKSAGGSYTAQQLLDQKKRQRSRCYYCAVKLGHVFHADHIVPLSRGGSNDISNIVITCPTCNLRKGKKLPHEWGQRLL